MSVLLLGMWLVHDRSAKRNPAAFLSLIHLSCYLFFERRTEEEERVRVDWTTFSWGCRLWAPRLCFRSDSNVTPLWLQRHYRPSWDKNPKRGNSPGLFTPLSYFSLCFYKIKYTSHNYETHIHWILCICAMNVSTHGNTGLGLTHLFNECSCPGFFFFSTSFGVKSFVHLKDLPKCFIN